MTVVTGPTWVERLPPSHCRRLLEQTEIGRVGVLVDSAPEIYPVNYALDGDSIVFRTSPGSKLRGLLKSPSVCFEIDGLDVAARTGWSVMVKGRAVEITDPLERAFVAELALTVWTTGDKQCWVRIRPEEITGRSVHRLTD